MRSGAALGSILVTIGGPTTATQTIAAGTSGLTTGTVLDNGSMRTNHTLVVTTSAGVTNGVVTLLVSQDNTNFFKAATITTNTASTVLAVNFVGAFRYVRGDITTAITGGTVGATIASI